MTPRPHARIPPKIRRDRDRVQLVVALEPAGADLLPPIVIDLSPRSAARMVVELMAYLGDRLEVEGRETNT